MSKKDVQNEDIIQMFGLSYDQTRLLFSAQKMIIEYDIRITNNLVTARKKREWLSDWEQSIADYLKTNNSKDNGRLIPIEDLLKAFLDELKDNDNKTWYYIVVLELIEFTAYYPLGKEGDKEYKKLKFNVDRCYDQIKDFIMSQQYISGEAIDRLDKTYVKSLNKISGKVGKLVTKVIGVVAVSALAAALTATFAGPIAVAIFGKGFAGLSGIALTNACLAMAGGGAIAVGGLGIQGGIIALAGGGALLGLAAGGTAAGVSSLLTSSPEYTLTQAAKLETILKEVILNAQQDVVTAQRIIQRYKEQIAELGKKITEMELKEEKTAKELKNIKAILEYMKKSQKDMSKFASSYQIGLESVK